MISSKTHAVLDYLMGLLLIVSPWLFGFADGSAATIIPVVLGASTIVYSLITAYEYSLASLLSFKAHLTIDFIAGLLLGVSPWLFGFHETVFVPHVVLGAFEIMAVLMTRKVTSTTAVPKI